MESNAYETLIFDVEYSLSKPKELMHNVEIKKILSSIFKRGIDYKKHPNKE